MKIATIVGARPQFVKAVVVSRLIRQRPGYGEIMIHTGQHYDVSMSDIFFSELALPEPDYHLNIGSGSHGAQTGKMLETIERVLVKEAPDLVLVYGDTNSTIAGGLAAVKLHIPIAHVEAGLRSFNQRMPEEINRVLVDHASSILFAPTKNAVGNLKKEGFTDDKVHLVGDVMYDATLLFSKVAKRTSKILKEFDLVEGGYILGTVHRAENTDNPARFRAVLDGLSAVADQWPLILPLHPRTRAALEKLEPAPRLSEKLRLVEPVGFLDMIMLEQHACLIVTDSGGVQKEAYFHHVPCVTLRDETEWVELIEAGWNTLCPPGGPESLYHAVEAAMNHRGKEESIYGDGNAAGKIVALLEGVTF